MKKCLKGTKQALVISIIMLVTCVAMFVGSTFAWFTDSVTSADNKIVAGTLQIQLLMHDGKEYVDISDSTKPIFGDGSIAQNNNAQTLWEPGKTQVAYLALHNNGELALKYTVQLDVTNTKNDLYQVMKYAVTPDAQYNTVTQWDETQGKAVAEGRQPVSDVVSLDVDQTHYFALSIHMDEKADNSYQAGEIDFDLTVLATQAAAEEDSFGDQYDAGATFVTPVSSYQQMADLLKQGGDMALATDITLSSAQTLTVPAGVTATLDLNGHNITAEQTGKDTYGTFTIQKGATLNVTGSGNVTLTTDVTSGISACIFQNDGTLNIYGGNYVANQEKSVAGLQAVIAVIDNCPNDSAATVNIYGGSYALTGVGAINIIRNWPISTTATTVLNIYGGTFKANSQVSTTYLWNKNDTSNNDMAAKMNFYGGTFEDGVVYEDYNGQDDIYIANGVNIKPYSGNN